MRIAVTGATGFIGRQLTNALARSANDVVLLCRRPGDFDANVEVVIGSLEDQAALESLVSQADVVIHIAGIVRSTDVGAFRRINAEATGRLAKLAGEAGCRRFLLVSSLAAGHPEVSSYAASKREGEELAAAALGSERLVIVRPPAVYGPGDEVTLPIFRQICAGLLLAPRVPDGRFSMIYVQDLTRLLTELIDAKSPPRIIEPDDGYGAYTWQDIADIGGRTAGVRVRNVGIPRSVLAPIAWLSDIAAKLAQRPMMLSGDKLGELFHRDWRASGTRIEEWAPEVQFAEGAEKTIVWYREHGWIKPSVH